MIAEGGNCSKDRNEWATENKIKIAGGRWKNNRTPVAEIFQDNRLKINENIEIQAAASFKYLGQLISFDYSEQRQRAV